MTRSPLLRLGKCSRCCAINVPWTFLFLFFRSFTSRETPLPQRIRFNFPLLYSEEWFPLVRIPFFTAPFPYRTLSDSTWVDNCGFLFFSPFPSRLRLFPKWRRVSLTPGYCPFFFPFSLLCERESLPRFPPLGVLQLRYLFSSFFFKHVVLAFFLPPPVSIFFSTPYSFI